jgi:hypothetical protein
MKTLFTSKYIEVSLVTGLVVGIAKADDTYALLLGFIVIEFKAYNMVKNKRGKWEGTRAGKPNKL